MENTTPLINAFNSLGASANKNGIDIQRFLHALENRKYMVMCGGRQSGRSYSQQIIKEILKNKGV